LSELDDPRLPWLENLLEEATSARRAPRWFRRQARRATPIRLMILSVGRERRRRRYWEL
jgi:hypothetical protein